MAVKINSVLIKPELSTGDVDFLLGSWLGGMVATIDCEVVSIAKAGLTADLEDMIFDSATKTITWNGGNFEDEGFLDGDTFDITGDATNNGSYTIASIAGNVITTVETLVNDTSETAIITNTTEVTGCNFRYNIIENGDNNDYVSKVDGQEIRHLKTGLDAMVTSFVDMVHQGVYSSNKFGVVRIKGAGSFNRFIIEHEFIINPLVLLDDEQNLINKIAPEYFDSANCLRYIYKIDLAENLNNPNKLHTSDEDTFKLGNTGWVGENFNGNVSKYSIDGFVFSVGGNVKENADYTQDTDFSITLKSTNGVFSNNNTKFVINHFVFPETFEQYQNTFTGETTNFMFDKALQTVGSASVDGKFFGTQNQVLKSITATFIDVNTIKIQGKISLSTQYKERLGNLTNKRFVVAVTVQDHTKSTIDSDVETCFDSVKIYENNNSNPDVATIETVFNEYTSETEERNDAGDFVEDTLIGRSIIKVDTSNGAVVNDVIAEVLAKKTEYTLNTNDISGFSAPKDGCYCTEKNTIYIVSNGTNFVSEIDPVTNTIIDTIDVGSISQGIDYNTNFTTYTKGRVYVGIANGIKVIDCSNNTVIATIALGLTPANLAYASLNDKIYTTTVASSFSSVIDCATNTLLTTLTAGSVPSGICYSDEILNKIYITNYGVSANSVTVVDCATDTILTTIGGITRGYGCTYDPVNKEVYVMQATIDKLKRIDAVTDTAIAGDISVGLSPVNGVYDTARKLLFVANIGDDSVSVVSTESKLLLKTFSVGSGPFGVDYCSSKGTVYLINNTNSTVQELIFNIIEDKFILEQKIIDCTDAIVSLGVQQINISESRGFTLKNGNPFNIISLKRRSDLDVSSEKAYELIYSFKLRWEDFISLPGVSTEFYDVNKLNNGFNQDWNRYFLQTDWKISYRVTANVEERDYVNSIQKESDVIVNTYGFNTDWTQTIKIYDIATNTEIPSNVLSDKIVRVEAVFTNVVPNAVPLDNIEGMIEYEPYQLGGENNIRNISTVRGHENTSPFISVLGNELLKKEIVSTYVYKLTANIDGKKLTGTPKISARLYDKSLPIGLPDFNIIALATGGVGPYTYTWSAPTGGVIVSGQGTGTIVANGGGLWSVSVTDSGVVVGIFNFMINCSSNGDDVNNGVVADSTHLRIVVTLPVINECKIGQRVTKNFVLANSGEEDTLPLFCDDGIADCGFILPKYADLSDDDDLKNDYFPYYGMFQDWTTSVVIKIQKFVGLTWTDQATITDNTYGEYHALGSYTSKPKYVGLVLSCKNLLTIIGEGQYRLKITEVNPLNPSGKITYSRQFCLKEWNCYLEKQVRIEWYNNKGIGSVDDDKSIIDFGDLNLFNQVRLPLSSFGKPKHTYETEETQFSNGLYSDIKINKKPKFELILSSIPGWLHDILSTYAVMSDTLQITGFDRNAPNNIIKKRVKISSGWEPRWSPNSPCAPVTVIFEPKINNLETYKCL